MAKPAGSGTSPANNSATSDRPHVAIVGGGIIGIASAHYCRNAGFRVTVIEAKQVGHACSQANCGLICPSHVLPMATPGAMREAFQALTSPGGAFRIRPRWDRNLWSWLWQFARRCRQSDMLQSAAAIQPLLDSSMQAYRQLVDDIGLQCQWQKQGLLFVHQQSSSFEAYAATDRLLSEQFDEPARRLSGAELTDFEPALQDGLAGAWYYEHDAHLRPDRLIQSWLTHLRAEGVQFVENSPLTQLQRTGQQYELSLSGHSAEITADYVVVATGAETPLLANILKHRAPIQPGKGYSITLPCPTDGHPRVPMIFPDHRVAATPFDDGLRLGSIMEFSGYDTEIRPERLRMLTTAGRQYLRCSLPDRIATNGAATHEPWFGWRPMTYDSLPIIGAQPDCDRLIFATGHNMLGLSMAPATGRLVSELIGGGTPHVDAAPYSPARF